MKKITILILFLFFNSFFSISQEQNLDEFAAFIFLKVVGNQIYNVNIAANKTHLNIADHNDPVGNCTPYNKVNNTYVKCSLFGLAVLSDIKVSLSNENFNLFDYPLNNCASNSIKFKNNNSDFFYLYYDIKIKHNLHSYHNDILDTNNIGKKEAETLPFKRKIILTDNRFIDWNVTPLLSQETVKLQYTIKGSSDNSSFKESDWKNLPVNNYLTTSFSTGKPFSGEDLLGKELYEKSIGKTIFFKVSSKCSSDTSNLVNYFLNKPNSFFYSIIPLKIIPSAPKIKEKKIIKPSCFYKEDGKIKITFNRDIKENEKLAIILTDTTKFENELTGETNNEPIKNIVLGSSDFDSTNSYTINSLASGKYEIKLLGSYIVNQDTISTFSDSDKHKATVIVPRADSVKFTTKIQEAIKCNGDSGKITITAEGGNGFYEYQVNGGDWISFKNNKKTATISTSISDGNTKKTYKISLRDSGKCNCLNTSGNLKVDTIKITQPPKLSMKINTENSQAHGFNNGKIKATIKGGTAPYKITFNEKTFKLSKNKIDTSFNKLPPGNYPLKITDKNGCSFTSQKITITEPALLKLQVKITKNISCSAKNNDGKKSADGKLEATASGGYLPEGKKYEYVWKKKNELGEYITISDENSSTLDNQAAGSYAVNVIDDNGITIGTYTEIHTENRKVDILDKKISLEEPPELKFSISLVKHVSCHGGSDGSIILNIEGGGDADTVHYKNERSDYKTILNGNTISGIKAGIYSVYVSNSKGCKTEVKKITIEQPEQPISIKTTTVDPTFYEATNGKIIAVVSGGTPKNDIYSYTWTDQHNKKIYSSLSSATKTKDGFQIELDGIGDGKYTLNVEDYNKCSHSIIYTIEHPPLLTGNIIIEKQIFCNSSNTFDADAKGIPLNTNGILKATVEGGKPFNPIDNNGLSYKYYWKQKIDGEWHDLLGRNYDTLSNIGAGKYAYNVEDANGISLGTRNLTLNKVTSVDKTIEFNEPEPIEITETITNVYCHGGADGSIKITVTGGAGDYTYKWLPNNITTKDISELSKGKYRIQVTDKNGCSASKDIIINEPESPLKIGYTPTLPLFKGATNGSIKAIIIGGTKFDDGSYKFIWTDSLGNNLNEQTTSKVSDIGYEVNLDGIGKGLYLLTVKDSNYSTALDKPNCTIKQDTFRLSEPKKLEGEIIINQPISCNSRNQYGDAYSDGILEAKIKGGVKLNPIENNGLEYEYTWKKEIKPGKWKVFNNQDYILRNVKEGKYAVNVKDANGITIGTYKQNKLDSAKDIQFYISEPTLLEVSIEKKNVYCHGGKDAWIKATITGGTPPYSTKWHKITASRETPLYADGQNDLMISQLAFGNYRVDITDARECHVSLPVTISQPEPLAITFKYATPSTAEANDGWILATITGGTPWAEGHYKYKWKTEAGNTLDNTQGKIKGKTYEILLSKIPKGKYFLTIEDSLHAIATTKTGCTIINKELTIYDPIEAYISVSSPISCNQYNKFNNIFNDGELKATVKGGLPFKNGNKYTYFWYKKLKNGKIESIDVNSPVISNLVDGQYILNVEDSRGMVIGTYKSDTLIKKDDVVLDFKEPEPLTVSLSTSPISCSNGNDGAIESLVEGGNAPYTYQWSNGATSKSITNLIAGNYVVYVTDAKGCQASANISLAPPGDIRIDVNKKAPSCFGMNNGTISLSLSGGQKPYTYSWSTGQTKTNISNLKSGTYIFKMQDAKGCNAALQVQLEEPQKLTLDLGKDQTICVGQEFTIDGTINQKKISYNWTSNNGFSSKKPIIKVKKSGKYILTAQSPAGCSVSDTISIIYKNVKIDANFLMSSQAYVNEEVVIFNVSNFQPESNEWILPENVELVEEKENNSITLKFSKTGSYKIGLISKKNGCSTVTYKKIIIEESLELPETGNDQTPFIRDFSITPNPNDGKFNVKVELAEKSLISLRIFNYNGKFITKKEPNRTLKEYNLDFNLNLANGVIYFIVIETTNQTQVSKIISK